MKALIIRLKPKSVLRAALINAAAYFMMLCVNIAADTLPINGITTREVSDIYLNLVTPAPYVFAIWGLIYMLLGQFCIYCFGTFSNAGSHKKFVLKIGYLFAASCILNSIWLIFWHYKLIAASFIIVALLLGDITIIFYKTYRLGRGGAADKLFVRIPFGIYTGWLLTAATANFAALCARSGNRVFSEYWTICVLLILLVIYIIFLFLFSSFEAAVVGLWSFSGILARHISYFNLRYPVIVVFCMSAIILLFVSCVIKFIRVYKPKKI